MKTMNDDVMVEIDANLDLLNYYEFFTDGNINVRGFEIDDNLIYIFFFQLMQWLIQILIFFHQVWQIQ